MRLVITRDAERSPLAKAAAGTLAAMGHTIRRFESFPSPPNLWAQVARLAILTILYGL